MVAKHPSTVGRRGPELNERPCWRRNGRWPGKPEVGQRLLQLPGNACGPRDSPHGWTPHPGSRVARPLPTVSRTRGALRRRELSRAGPGRAGAGLPRGGSDTRRGGLLRMREPAGAPPAGPEAARSSARRRSQVPPPLRGGPAAVSSDRRREARAEPGAEGRDPARGQRRPPSPGRRGSVSAARTRISRALARRALGLGATSPPGTPSVPPAVRLPGRAPGRSREPAAPPPCLRPPAPAQQVHLPAMPGRPDSGCPSARALGVSSSPQAAAQSRSPWRNLTFPELEPLRNPLCRAEEGGQTFPTLRAAGLHPADSLSTCC